MFIGKCQHSEKSCIRQAVKDMTVNANELNLSFQTRNQAINFLNGFMYARRYSYSKKNYEHLCENSCAKQRMIHSPSCEEVENNNLFVFLFWNLDTLIKNITQSILKFSAPSENLQYIRDSYSMPHWLKLLSVNSFLNQRWSVNQIILFFLSEYLCHNFFPIFVN